jgi:hypothetical protein
VKKISLEQQGESTVAESTLSTANDWVKDFNQLTLSFSNTIFLEESLYRICVALAYLG